MADLESNGRDGRGRFTYGNPGGPGNPKLKQLSEYQEAIRKAVKPEFLEAIMRRLVASALEGDEAAARAVLERVLGRPTDPETLDSISAASAVWKLIAEKIRPAMPEVADELVALLEEAGAARRLTIRIG